MIISYSSIKIKNIVFVLFLTACQPQQEQKLSDDELKVHAQKLAHEFIITDGHVDLPYKMRMAGLRNETVDFTRRTGNGDFDYIRAQEGGLDAPFMSIYIPSSYQETGGARELADSLIDWVHSIPETYPDKFALAGSPEEVRENFNKGLISLPMGMENGAPIEDDISNIAYFYGRGIRYITLTHARDNQICDSSYDTTRTWNGLSPFGEEVVREMNRVGIMVDVSHISDSTFYQVMEIIRAPVIASHSSCRRFTPGFERNMSDDMIEKLAENGGVIQINFGSSFLDSAVVSQNDQREAQLHQLVAEAGLSMEDSAAAPLIEEFREENPKFYADIEKVADHIDHVVNLVGIEHVGFGSDFDGVGDSLPTGLKDVSQYPNLIYELLKRGYSDEDIEKICYKNVFRVWNNVEEVAQTLQNM